MSTARYRHQAQATYKELSKVLHTEGDEAYISAVKNKLGKPRDSSVYTAKLFGGIA